MTKTFNENVCCDTCGRLGAYDYHGEFICPHCINEILKEWEKKDDGERKD